MVNTAGMLVWKKHNLHSAGLSVRSLEDIDEVEICLKECEVRGRRGRLENKILSAYMMI